MKIPLSNITLGRAIANVRSQTGTLNEAESALYYQQVIDIIHRAVLLVWGKEKKLLNEFYTTTTTADVNVLSNGMVLVPLSAERISDFDTIMLTDDAGPIDMMTRQVYNNIKSVYTTEEMSYGRFAIIDSVPAYEAGGTYGIELVLGNNAPSISNLRLSYVRVPEYATTSSTELDIPDQYVPIVEATACRMVVEKLRGMAPQQDTKIIEDLNAQMGGRK